uniref:Uncharacterized protein n=1 Tax=Kalanchoe fedtschenkoi TaxID=63787 RepID=A0A7N0ZWT7_KALFE
MKFGKEFASQIVPEWKDAYVDYGSLKKWIKRIGSSARRSRPPPQSPYRAFSGLLRKKNVAASSGEGDVENPPIRVGRSLVGEAWETVVLVAGDGGGADENEVRFFGKLDEEFNKVERFYAGKAEEVVAEAEMLNKQMDALIAFRVKVDRPYYGGFEFDQAAEASELAADVAVSVATLSASTPSSARAHRKAQMEVIAEGGDGAEAGTREMVDFNERGPGPEQKASRLASLGVLKHATMDTALVATPYTAIKDFFTHHKDDEQDFSRRNLKKVEGQLRLAFVEFYNKLRLLKSYSFLNMLALSKIMKKYDKTTSRNASKPFLRMVDNSFLGSSEEVTKLIVRVEDTFVKHFSNSNRRKGMDVLRPTVKREKHRTTFYLGLFAGCGGALILALLLVIRARNILGSEGGSQYMNTMFPLYSLFGFIVLHIIMYGANVYFWRRYRVNYSFIFGFKRGTELGYREVFLLSFAIAVLALVSVLLNLDMEMDPLTQDYGALTELLPLIVILLLMAVLLFPFNILYRSTRFFFLASVFHCILAPLYKVTFPDFFLADQLTSQVQAFRSLLFYVCYYGWGDYKLRQNSCRSSSVYNTFFFIVAVIPYWSRLLQCLRRLFEEKDPMQGFNGLKYFSTIIAVSMRTAYSLNNGMIWMILAWATSVIAAVYGLYWDLVVDWGLLQKNSRNRWLRDKLMIPNKGVYFVAMALNVLLKFAWLQTVLNFQVLVMHRQLFLTVVASLEIIRRGIWNFFRLENEHLNNVGKYRAFKSVPLPFIYDEDDKAQ